MNSWPVVPFGCPLTPPPRPAVAMMAFPQVDGRAAGGAIATALLALLKPLPDQPPGCGGGAAPMQVGL